MMLPAALSVALSLAILGCPPWQTRVDAFGRVGYQADWIVSAYDWVNEHDAHPTDCSNVLPLLSDGPAEQDGGWYTTFCQVCCVALCIHFKTFKLRGLSDLKTTTCVWSRILTCMTTNKCKLLWFQKSSTTLNTPNLDAYVVTGKEGKGEGGWGDVRSKLNTAFVLLLALVDGWLVEQGLDITGCSSHAVCGE